MKPIILALALIAAVPALAGQTSTSGQAADTRREDGRGHTDRGGN